MSVIPSGALAADRPVVIKINAPGLVGLAPLYLALENGCFTAEGLDVQIADGPMLFHHGADDTLILPAAVAEIKNAFAGKLAQFYEYEQAGHGVNCWARDAYHQPSAALAHGRTLEFLAKFLS